MIPEDALVEEFGTQYLVDELPRLTPEFVNSVFPRWAKLSALRLARAADIDATLQLLHALRSDRKHVVIGRLSEASGLEWEEDYWEVFSRLMTMIAETLQTIREGKPVSLGVNVYREDEGSSHRYVLEDAETRLPILWVEEPELQGSSLVVTFETNDPKVTASRGSTLIAKHLLKDFLLDRYRGRAHDVEYCRKDANDTLRLRYPS